MKTLSIDIETYSGTDLNKCGVYKYAEDFSVERSSAYNKKNRALDKLTLLLYGE